MFLSRDALHLHFVHQLDVMSDTRLEVLLDVIRLHRDHRYGTLCKHLCHSNVIHIR
jgi:hypothetical protein